MILFLTESKDISSFFVLINLFLDIKRLNRQNRGISTKFKLTEKIAIRLCILLLLLRISRYKLNLNPDLTKPRKKKEEHFQEYV